MKVLFIGATGLVGSHAVPFLTQKFDLTLTAFNSGNVAELEVTALDITDWEATAALIQQGTSDGKPFDAIVYCATANYRGNSGDRDSRHRYFENCIEVNARGAYHVFEAAWRANVAKVVHIGSMTAMLGAPEYEQINAESRDRPNDLYAATKIFGEHVGRSYVFRPRQKRKTSLKPPTQSMQVLCLRLGQPFIDEQHWKNSPHVGSRLATSMEDIAQAIECSLLTEVRYGVYSIVSAVENTKIDPELYAEIGYKPRWKFFNDGSIQINQNAETQDLQVAEQQ